MIARIFPSSKTNGTSGRGLVQVQSVCDRVPRTKVFEGMLGRGSLSPTAVQLETLFSRDVSSESSTENALTEDIMRIKAQHGTRRQRPQTRCLQDEPW
jgi:hypothetical protein